MNFLGSASLVISIAGMISLQILMVYLSRPIRVPMEEDILLYRSKIGLEHLCVSNTCCF
jgi:hypothetical protein